jgi:hypothetical protein
MPAASLAGTKQRNIQQLRLLGGGALWGRSASLLMRSHPQARSLRTGRLHRHQVGYFTLALILSRPALAQASS